MQEKPQLSEPVRCVACHTVYDQLSKTAQAQETGGCPSCGTVIWLALSVSVDQTAVPALS